MAPLTTQRDVVVDGPEAPLLAPHRGGRFGGVLIRRVRCAAAAASCLLAGTIVHGRAAAQAPVITSVEVTSYTTGSTSTIAQPQTRIPALTIRGHNFFQFPVGPLIVVSRPGGNSDSFIGQTNINGSDADGDWVIVRNVDLSKFGPGSFDVSLRRHSSEPAVTVPDAINLLRQGPERLESRGAWGGPINEMKIAGDRMYLAVGRRLVILDRTDETNLVELGAIDLLGPVVDIEVLGSYVLAAVLSAQHGLCVVDVSNPAAPRLAWSTDIREASDVEVHGNMAYVVGLFPKPFPAYRIGVFNMASPEDPEPLETLWNGQDVGVRHIEIDGDRLYADRPDSNNRTRASIYNLAADPLNPPLLGMTGEFTATQRVSGGRLVVTDSSEGSSAPFRAALVIDASIPSLPLVETLVQENAPPGVTWNGWVAAAAAPGLLFVCERKPTPGPQFPAGGLRIYDTATTPSSPTLLSTFRTHGSVYGVEVIGQRAYVFDAGEGLIVLDISNPANPVRIGGYHSPAAPHAMTQSGDLLLVSDEWNGFTVLDVADPARPRVVGVYQTPGAEGQGHWGIAHRDGVVYLAAGYGGVDVVDISDPTAPVRIGGYPVPPNHTVRAVELDGDILRIAVKGGPCPLDPNAALHAVYLDATNPAQLTPIVSVQVACTGEPTRIQTVANVTRMSGHPTLDLSNLITIDNTDPHAPVPLATGDLVFDCVVAGDVMYVGSWLSQLGGQQSADPAIQTWDVSSPTAPVRTAEFNITAAAPWANDEYFTLAFSAGRLFAFSTLDAHLGGSPLQMFEPVPGALGLRLVAAANPQTIGSFGGCELLATPDRVYATYGDGFHAMDDRRLYFYMATGLAIIDRVVRCRSDVNDDAAVNSMDISTYLAMWLTSLTEGDLLADFNADGRVNSADVSAFVGQWHSDLTSGPCL